MRWSVSWTSFLRSMLFYPCTFKFIRHRWMVVHLIPTCAVGDLAVDLRGLSRAAAGRPAGVGVDPYMIDRPISRPPPSRSCAGDRSGEDDVSSDEARQRRGFGFGSCSGFDVFSLCARRHRTNALVLCASVVNSSIRSLYVRT